MTEPVFFGPGTGVYDMECTLISKVWCLEQTGSFLFSSSQFTNTTVVFNHSFFISDYNYCLLFTYYVPGPGIS